MSEDESESSPEVGFRIWINQQSRGNTLGRFGAVIKSGQQVVKTVTLSKYGDRRTGEVSKRELRFRTHERNQSASLDFYEPDPKTTWWCENDEIEKLLAFLHSDVARTGRYRVVDTDSPGAALLELLQSRNVDAQALVDGLVKHCDVRQIVGLLAGSDFGLSAVELVVVAKRRELVARLRRLIRQSEATETRIQQMIGDAYWLFGGRYVGVADRRNLMPLDEHDIPLLGADGTLHIVELKGPNIEGLVVPHRNHWIVGTQVHKAVAQAMNYLRGFDEMGLGLSKVYENELGQKYDMRRVFATVVIGQSKHAKQTDSPTVVAQTLRSYNAHLSRVEVITYDQLVDSAERALVFEEDAKQAQRPEIALPVGNENIDEADEDEPWRTGLRRKDLDAWSDDEPPF